MTPGQGQRREAILRAATERFGRDGYEHTKWADIAADVGVGPTALYHYFESKQHCLYVIMDEAIEHFRARFIALTARRGPGRGAAGGAAGLLRPLRAGGAAQPRCSSPSRACSRPARARRARSRPARPRGRARAISSSPGRASSPARCAGRDPGDRPADAHACGPRPLQQHLAVVPAERDRRPDRRARLLQRAHARHDRRRPRRADPTEGWRHDVLRAVLRAPSTGPTPTASLELVADDVEFSIQWATGEDRKSSQFLGGLEELRGFIDAGDTTGWAHHVVCSGDQATSSSRSARRAGTTAASASAPSSPSRSSTPTAACAATWSPARPRWSSHRCSAAEFIPVADGLIAGTAAEPRLIGSRVPSLRHGHLPAPGAPARAARPSDVRERRLARAGRCGPGRSSASRRSRRRTSADEASSPTASATSSCRARCASRRASPRPTRARLRIGMPMELTLDPGARRRRR